MSEDEKPSCKTKLYQFRFQFWKKFPWRWLLIFVSCAGALAIIGIVILYFSKLPESWGIKLFIDCDPGTRNKYLLSAAAQVLGAIFVLVFSITLVAGQTVVKYTHRALTIIFDKWIFLYAISFAWVIVGILWCIQYPTDLLTPLALSIGGLFTLSIPVFIFYLIRKMNLQWMLQEFKRIGIKAIRNRVDEQAREMIEALDNIGTVALKEGNFEALEAAEEALVDLLLEVGRYHNDPQRKQPELHREIFETLRAACLEAIDNPRVPRVIIEKLGRVGAIAIEEWLKSSNIPKDATYEEIKDEIPQTALYAINIIMIVSEACEKESQDPLIFVCVVALGKMLEAAKSLKSLRDWIARKVEGVRGRFKNKKRWDNKVG